MKITTRAILEAVTGDADVKSVISQMRIADAISYLISHGVTKLSHDDYIKYNLRGIINKDEYTEDCPELMSGVWDPDDQWLEYKVLREDSNTVKVMLNLYLRIYDYSEGEPYDTRTFKAYKKTIILGKIGDQEDVSDSIIDMLEDVLEYDYVAQNESSRIDKIRV